ncbi:gluconokinase [Anaeromyxobacter sp. Fw109-5]|uniref:gluconokinase n=1 Tax=Anaeromyxobacter sp. (strain Fw109-5) TaxID=404589 RepID=UPI0000ED78B6|nr:gluconokinase [Anaeromyxobacter sp. Fw109-5]ABS24809.1 carbohydrate kinase, thermoresistant glucokinase family [Anaeromyxobacter sp. Fw109-5]
MSPSSDGPTPPESQPRADAVRATPAVQLVVMGVSGSGKSSVAERLAQRLGCELAEGDTFHSAANLAKMRAGVPLDDRDRGPWLRDLAAWIQERDRAGRCAVVTCSALKRAYRDVLRAASAHLAFVHLAGTPELLAKRVHARTGHFMPERLLASQLAALEPLGADERGVTIDVTAPLEEVVAAALAALKLDPAATATSP